MDKKTTLRRECVDSRAHLDFEEVQVVHSDGDWAEAVAKPPWLAQQRATTLAGFGRR